MTCLLEARNVSVVVGDRTICQGLDLSVMQGERWGILGVNGAGKTSLLHALCGIRGIRSGKIRLKGKDIAEMKRRDIALAAGILFQDSEDHFPSTVLETALIGRHPHISPWQWENAEDESLAREAIRLVGLSGMENRMTATLSGGERRRLAMATLLVQDPEIFLLDEPTNHLDIRHQIEMLDLFAQRTMKADKAMIMILHDPNMVQRYCDRVLLLFENGESLQGDRNDILNEANLSRLYAYPVSCFEGPAGKLFFPAQDQTVPESGLKTGCL